MTNVQVTYLVAIVAAVVVVVSYVGLVLVPAWTAYSRVWQRLCAAFLSLYVLAAFLMLGAGGGFAVFWFWDRFAGG